MSRRPQEEVVDQSRIDGDAIAYGDIGNDQIPPLTTRLEMDSPPATPRRSSWRPWRMCHEPCRCRGRALESDPHDTDSLGDPGRVACRDTPQPLRYNWHSRSGCSAERQRVPTHTVVCLYGSADSTGDRLGEGALAMKHDSPDTVGPASRRARRLGIWSVGAATLIAVVVVFAHKSAPEACSFLTRQEISGVIGSPVAAPQPNASDAPWAGSGCVYPGFPAYVLVWSLRHGGEKMYAQQHVASSPVMVGHDYRAFSWTDSGNETQSLYLLKHGQYVNVVILNQRGDTTRGAADLLAALVAQRIR